MLPMRFLLPLPYNCSLHSLGSSASHCPIQLLNTLPPKPPILPCSLRLQMLLALLMHLLAACQFPPGLSLIHFPALLLLPCLLHLLFPASACRVLYKMPCYQPEFPPYLQNPIKEVLLLVGMCILRFQYNLANFRCTVGQFSHIPLYLLLKKKFLPTISISLYLSL